jgi:hypothetical protein
VDSQCSSCKPSSSKSAAFEKWLVSPRRGSMNAWPATARAAKAALIPRSWRPHHWPNRIPEALENEIVELRSQLSQFGTDAGADTIHTHLDRSHGGAAPCSVSTIWCTLTRARLITPGPRKPLRAPRFASKPTCRTSAARWTPRTSNSKRTHRRATQHPRRLQPPLRRQQRLRGHHRRRRRRHLLRRRPRLALPRVRHQP